MNKNCYEHRLTIATLVGIFSGGLIGAVLKNFTEQPWTERAIMFFQFPGDVFLRTVNMLIIPLVVSSIVSASCNLSKSGTIGLKALYYYTATTTLGITLSVILSQTIRPGEIHRNDNSTIAGGSKNFIATDIFLDLFRNLFTDNIVTACVSQYQTFLIEPSNASSDDGDSIYFWKISSRETDGTNILGLVMWSLLLGIAIGHIGNRGKPLLHFFDSLSGVMMMTMDKVTQLAPFGVLFLVPGKILETDDIGAMLTRLGVYVMTVFLGLIIHGLVVLPTLYFVCTRKSPFKILAKVGPAFVTACGTSSSTATVPMTLKCLDRIGVDRKVSRFVVPLGATINMDGIALYETIGAMFIIQLRGLDISLIKVIAISITCTVSCIGAAGLPNGGYMMLILVLNSIGIPASDVMLIITIDCLVDRFRTTVNIVADSLGAGVISHLTRNEEALERLDETTVPLNSVLL
ncbi:excitatory amino acid transporter 3-like [Venturia canescens]|uniref:excitatory amino acid transporter 3-like n=1 Tax=Venturia canescens TaxID=32260 RepID=UPI001C9D403F|nr:excitatory amino acid transporter 3-like [Venturia canescens]